MKGGFRNSPVWIWCSQLFCSSIISPGEDIRVLVWLPNQFSAVVKWMNTLVPVQIDRAHTQTRSRDKEDFWMLVSNTEVYPLLSCGSVLFKERRTLILHIFARQHSYKWEVKSSLWVKFAFIVVIHSYILLHFMLLVYYPLPSPSNYFKLQQ